MMVYILAYDIDHLVQHDLRLGEGDDTHIVVLVFSCLQWTTSSKRSAF